MDNLEFQGFLTRIPGIPAAAVPALIRYRELVLAENEVQNLTRLVSPRDFAESHVRDAWEAVQTGWLPGTTLDLGAGLGVPGIPAAILAPESRWILAESEQRKADFLKRAVEILGLGDRVEVFAGRAEDFLKDRRVDTVIARAVGPVSRLWAWIGERSTWNKMVLLKSRGWDEEWAAPESARARKKLRLAAKHEYEVGEDHKYRVMVRLERI